MATVRPPSTAQYSTHPLEQLLILWGRGELTETQMIGHLLQHQIDQESRLRRLEHPPTNPSHDAGSVARK